MEEIWKPCPSYPSHEASSFGRIRSIPFERPMPHGGTRTYGGKATFGAWSERDKRFITVLGSRCFKVARMVCDAFHGPAEPGQVCMHLDEDSRNNRPDNLQWGTQKENLNAPGFLAYCGSADRPNKNRLPFDKIQEIRRRSSEPRANIAREFGVSASQVSNIIAGRTRVKK
jgi:HNH endonuclease/NUMOD4 motif